MAFPVSQMGEQCGRALTSATEVAISSDPPTTAKTPRTVPLYSKADWPRLRHAVQELSNIITTSFNDTSDTELIWTKFKEGLQAAVKNFVPHITLKTKSSKPWVDPETKKMIRRRDRLYKKWKKTKDEGLQNQIKVMKRHIQRRLRRAYWSFTENLITDSPNSYPTTKRSFLSYIKSQRTEAANVSPLKVDGKLVTDPKDKAKALNAQFQSAFSKKFPCSPEDFKSWTGLNAEPEGPTDWTPARHLARTGLALDS
ncbi:hypothetical protein ACOMHN_033313 [Nucella lapillus]